MNVSTRFIGRPRMPWTQYPWRPMDNRERLARWAMLYYAQYGRKEERK
jgi:hypothetical protein